MWASDTFARHRHVAPADQAHIYNHMVQRARARCPACGAVAGRVIGAVDAGAVNGPGQSHVGQDSREPQTAGYQRASINLPAPVWPQELEVMGRTPALIFSLPLHPERLVVLVVN